jgi:predicted dehydrogenase
MGRGHLGAFLGNKAVQVVAICDVVEERRQAALKSVENRYAEDKQNGLFKGCTVYNNFRELLARKDIDAVVIATPDHWHAIPCIEAAKAGKHIYCEKPLTHNVVEGRRIVEAAAAAKIIFQTGSQQRSEFGNRFRTAVEYVRNGRIGKVKTVRIGVGGPAKACDLPDQDAPNGTDWDLWLGPAPMRKYNEILCPKGVHSHFPAWRNYLEYAGGGLADMGAHHFDIAQWALDMDGSGPVKIEPPEKDTKGLRFVYANGIEMFHGGEADCVFVGTEGTIRVSRGKLESDPADLFKTPIAEKEWHCYPSSNQRQNWVDCIKAGKPCICTAEIGHRSATICHLGNIGYRLRRALKWDPVKEVFIDDAEANKLLSREGRGDWKI